MALTFDYIQQVNLASTTTLTGIPNTYTDLRLVVSTTGTGGGLVLRYNGDSTDNYTTTRFLVADTGTAAVSRLTGHSGIIPSGTATPNANLYWSTIWDIFNYASNLRYKTTLGQGTQILGSTSGQIHFCSGVWLNQNAITSITIANLTSPTGIATLYGIKAA